MKLILRLYNVTYITFNLILNKFYYILLKFLDAYYPIFFYNYVERNFCKEGSLTVRIL